MKILAFGHRKRVGKDEITKFLITELRLKYKGISIFKAGFADKVKDVSYQIYGWAGLMPGGFYETEEGNKLKDVILPKLGRTPRQLWIGVGNGIRQVTQYDGTWSDYLFNTIKADILIIQDCRFPAEANDILKYGGHLYRIDRAVAPVVTDGADDPLQDYDKWTGVIKNNGTLSELHKEALGLIERHFSWT